MSQELQSVKNALIILKCFTVENDRLQVTEISQLTGLAKSTVSRTLSTLMSEGFVRKSKDNKTYILGLSILNLAGIALSSIRIQQELSPTLSQLVMRTNESGHIAILDGKDIVYIQKEESIVHTEMKTYLGRRNPAHATSSGKLLLAFQDTAYTDKILKEQLVACTTSTITNPLKLREEMQKIRVNGFSYSKDELTEGVSSLAVPVRDYTNSVVASIALVGATSRFTTKKINDWVPMLLQASKASSKQLGYWK